MNMKYISLALGASMLALGLTACSGSSAESTATQDSDSLAVQDVEWTEARMDTIHLDEAFTATLEAKVKNNISAQSGGRLAQLLVQVGDRVAKGQVVARLEATQLTTAQIQLKDAQANFGRMDELYKVGGISKAQWEQAKSAMDIAREQVNNLAINTALRSPISGIVTAKNYDNGDMTSPTLPVVVIEQISPLKVTVHVSETYYQHLKEGIKATLNVESFGDRSFEGRVSNVYPTIDSQTHTVAVEVEFANRDLALRPGMYGKLLLALGKRPALMVPDRAIQRTVGSGTRFVYVHKDGVATYRVVELGSKVGALQEITSGLAPGEAVVTTGLAGLKNGAKIK